MSDFVHVDPPIASSPNATLAEGEGPAPSTPSKSLNNYPFIQETVLDKIYGCIIGSALGDTIGLYTEFLSKAQSDQIYPTRRFQLTEPATELHQDYHRCEHFQLDEVFPISHVPPFHFFVPGQHTNNLTARFAPCAWTDDTDQALLIILSYIHNYTHAQKSPSAGPSPNGHANNELPSDFAKRLQIWVEQGLLALNRHPCGLGALVGSVVTSSNYLEDPSGIATKKWLNSSRYNAPNGSLMRTHPIGVLGLGMSEQETWDLSVGVGWTTHVDPRCTVSCCIEVALIRGLMRGEILNEEHVNACIERSYEWVRNRPDLMNPGGDTGLTDSAIAQHLDRREFERHAYAETLKDLKLDHHKELGYVYKCLGSAILLLRFAMRRMAKCSAARRPLVQETLFEELTVDLIMEGGDADTNGAAACALLGAYLGYSKIPPHWKLGLAHKEWLLTKTYRLAVASGVLSDVMYPEDDEAADGGRRLMNKTELDKRWALIMAQTAKRMQDAKDRSREDAERRDKKKGLVGWFAN